MSDIIAHTLILTKQKEIKIMKALIIKLVNFILGKKAYKINFQSESKGAIASVVVHAKNFDSAHVIARSMDFYFIDSIIAI